MEDNSLLMIVLAFVLGCMCSQMMKQMCGGRLVEGLGYKGDICHSDSGCLSNKCELFDSLSNKVGTCDGDYD